MKAISVETMKQLDARTIEAGTPGETLMERAGQGVFCELEKLRASYWSGCGLNRFSVLAGKGNNGGDAYVVARILAENGYAVKIFAVCAPEELKGAAAYHAEKARAKVPVEVCDTLPSEVFAQGTIVVDGLLGTGIKGTLKAPYDHIIGAVNASQRPVVAIDVPSGLDADTGEIATDAVKADLTVTMAQPKYGMVTRQGLAVCGRLRRVDIGVAPEEVDQAPGECEAVLIDDLYRFNERRPLLSHKKTFGQVYLIAGSREYTGAGMLAAGAALRSGAGLVRSAVPESIRHLISPPFDALIFDPVRDNASGCFTEEALDVLVQQAEQSDAVVIGPGIGTAPETCRCVRELLQTSAPVVLDADGLTMLANHREWAEREAPLIVTPHPGEMKRLLAGFGLDECDTAERREQACLLAEKADVWVVLKGFGTMLASPSGHWAVNVTGNDALASAGTGDILAGLLGGFLAQGLTPWEALTHAACLHGVVGETTEKGARAVTADDILQGIPATLKGISPFP